MVMALPRRNANYFFVTAPIVPTLAPRARRGGAKEKLPDNGAAKAKVGAAKAKEKLPDKGLEPLTTRLRVLRSAD